MTDENGPPTREELQAYNEKAFNAPPPSDLQEAIGDLKSALLIAERVKSGQYEDVRLDSVAWRTADALLLIEKCARKAGLVEVCGIDCPTGRGAMLRRK